MENPTGPREVGIHQSVGAIRPWGSVAMERGRPSFLWQGAETRRDGWLGFSGAIGWDLVGAAKAIRDSTAMLDGPGAGAGAELRCGSG